MFENIIQNSYKYADTEIQVSYELQDGFLMMQIKDKEPGVPVKERDLGCGDIKAFVCMNVW